MFRALATQLSGGPPITQAAAEQVLELHPMQLSRYLEDAWLKRSCGRGHRHITASSAFVLCRGA